MSGHTPGPWRLETVMTACGICHKIGPFPPKPGTARENHACIYSDYPGRSPHDVEMLANAHLIAAAPKLLKACELLVAYDDGDPERFEDIVLAYAKAVEAARSAIAAATGETT
jgi:hypothetical protein